MKTLRTVLLIVFAAVMAVACGNDGDEPEAPASATTAPATTAAPTAPGTTAAPSVAPTAEETDGGAAPSDTAAQAEAIVACLEEGGMEAKAEEEELPIFGEEYTIGVTFVFESVGAKVPDAVTVTLYPSADVAKKAKKEIDEDLLEGDTPTVLIGNAVLDDFGSPLTEPEAAEQAQTLQSCVEQAAG